MRRRSLGGDAAAASCRHREGVGRELRHRRGRRAGRAGGQVQRGGLVVQQVDQQARQATREATVVLQVHPAEIEQAAELRRDRPLKQVVCEVQGMEVAQIAQRGRGSPPQAGCRRAAVSTVRSGSPAPAGSLRSAGSRAGAALPGGSTSAAAAESPPRAGCRPDTDCGGRAGCVAPPGLRCSGGSLPGRGAPNEIRLPSSAGIAPLRRFAPRSRCRNDVRLPSSAGIAPLSSFLASRSALSCDSSPNSAGMLPLSVLSWSVNCCMRFRAAVRRHPVPVGDRRAGAPVERGRARQRVLRREQQGTVAGEAGVVGLAGERRPVHALHPLFGRDPRGPDHSSGGRRRAGGRGRRRVTGPPAARRQPSPPTTGRGRLQAGVFANRSPSVPSSGSLPGIGQEHIPPLPSITFPPPGSFRSASPGAPARGSTHARPAGLYSPHERAWRARG